MKNINNELVYLGINARKITVVLAMCTPILLTGCSYVPDAVNPVEWYNSSADYFTSDADPESSQPSNANVGTEVVAGDDQFPNLASVDQQKQARDNISGGLVADTSGRKRTDAVALQGNSAVRPLETQVATAPPATTTAAAIAPISPAVPATTVPTNAQVAELPTSSLATTPEDKDFETRMARRLAEIQARAANNDTGLAETPAMGFYGNQLPTVIISATGVETASYQAGSTFNTSSFMGQPSLTNNNGISNPASLPVQGRSVKVATILFANGSSNLNSRDRSILRKVLKLAQQQGGQLRIVGHASSRTRNLDLVRHKMINFEVSVKRADAVARELVRLGLRKEDLLVGAVSDLDPQFFEYMPTGEAGNRRTEIYIDT